MNPFRFETPLDPAALIGRDDEIAQLVRYAQERRIVSVAAPRRYGPDGEGVLRSHSQAPEQAGKVAYAFAGSEPSLLAAAFADQGRAYYQQVLQLPLGRLADRELSLGIARLFARTDKDSGTALGPLVQLAAGHPQRAMLLAHLLWDATGRRSSAGTDTWQRALVQARALTSDEAQAIWESLTPAQRAALRSVVLHSSPTVVEADPAVSKGSRQSAATLLLRRGLVEADPEPGPRGGRRYRLVDPMLGDWVRQRRS